VGGSSGGGSSGRLPGSAVEQGRATGEFDARLDPEHTLALAAVIQGGSALARAERSAEPFERAIQGALELLRLGMPGAE